jgi:hypothetical protein
MTTNPGDLNLENPVCALTIYPSLWFDERAQ